MATDSRTLFLNRDDMRCHGSCVLPWRRRSTTHKITSTRLAIRMPMSPPAPQDRAEPHWSRKRQGHGQSGSSGVPTTRQRRTQGEPRRTHIHTHAHLNTETLIGTNTLAGSSWSRRRREGLRRGMVVDIAGRGVPMADEAMLRARRRPIGEQAALHRQHTSRETKRDESTTRRKLPKMVRVSPSAQGRQSYLAQDIDKQSVQVTQRKLLHSRHHGGVGSTRTNHLRVPMENVASTCPGARSLDKLAKPICDNPSLGYLHPVLVS